jgi:hypothetical protein
MQIYVDESGDLSIPIDTIGNDLDLDVTTGLFDLQKFAEEHDLDAGLLELAIDSAPSIFSGDLFAELQTKVNTVINTLKQNPKNLPNALEDLYEYLNSKDSNGTPYIK